MQYYLHHTNKEHNAMKQLFFQPENAWVGDLIPYYENGTYYAFYYDSLNDCYSLASSPVVVTINQCKKALIITNPILRNKAK